MNAPVTGQERQRHLRIATLLAGQFASGEFRCPCEILNVSIGGARLRLQDEPGTLDEVVVQVEGYPDLTGHHDVVTGRRRARDSDLADEQVVPADLTVVGDHDEVVDLGTGPDAGRPERPTIDGRTGPNLHVVGDFNPTQGFGGAAGFGGTGLGGG